MKSLPTDRPPTARELDKWAAQFLRRRVVTGETWSLVDVFRKSEEAKRVFVQLCDDGCDPTWLATELIRLPVWSSGKSGRKPFGPSAKQIRVLKRVLKDLRSIIIWEPFPMLTEPDAGETMFFKIRDFEASLRRAMTFLPANHLAQFTAANAQALAATSIINGIKSYTKTPHFREAALLFDEVLKAAGRKDLFNNAEKLKKLVKRYSPR